MKRLLLLGAALSLSGCAAAPAWLTIVAPALGYVASINNLGAEYLRFTDGSTLVCPVALAPQQPCPVAKVRSAP